MRWRLAYLMTVLTLAGAGLLLPFVQGQQADEPLFGENRLSELLWVQVLVVLIVVVAGLLVLRYFTDLPKLLLKIYAWFDERFQLYRYVRTAKREYYSTVFTLLPSTGRTVPISHTERYNIRTIWYWYPFYCLGGISFLAFIILTLTGVYLGFYYVPSGTGTPSPAYDSMKLIMTQVQFGYILRAVHHWAAHFMVAAVFLHMMRVYFVGAYRNPRELNWLLGVMLLGVTIGFGYTGYLLPWDSLAFAAGTIGLEMITSVPLLGGPLAQLVFGGTHLSGATVLRMYWLHVFILPAVGFGMMIFHMLLVWVQGEAEPH